MDGSLSASGIARKYPWQPCKREPPLHVAANRHRHTEGNSVENIHLTPYLPTDKPKKGREGVGARIRKDLNKKARSAKISSKCQHEMQRKSQDKQCAVHMHLLEGGDLTARRFFGSISFFVLRKWPGVILITAGGNGRPPALNDNPYQE